MFDRIKGWLTVAAALGAAVALYVLGEEMEIGPHRELAYALGGFGVLFALALAFQGTEFGRRMQSLSLFLVCAGVTVLFWHAGSEKGWGVGTGALTALFGLFALAMLKNAIFGGGEGDKEE